MSYIEIPAYAKINLSLMSSAEGKMVTTNSE